jgi:hypothetical protein
LTSGYIFIIIATSITVTGGIIMVYEIPISLFKIETGFISSEDAKKIIPLDLAHMHLIGPTFVLLKYHNQDDSLNVTMYDADPYSKEVTGEGLQIFIFCKPCQWEGQSDRFAWSIGIEGGGASFYFVDARTSKFIGIWNACPRCS